MGRKKVDKTTVEWLANDAAVTRAYNIRNKDRTAARQKDYRANNSEKIAASKKEWREKNQTYSADYYLANKENWQESDSEKEERAINGKERYDNRGGKERRAKRYEDNKDEVLAQQQSYRDNNSELIKQRRQATVDKMTPDQLTEAKEKRTARYLKRVESGSETVRGWKRRGITFSMAEYDEMFLAQGGCCKLCLTDQSSLKRKLSVDHCHTTGKIRGLLCFNCNTGIGHLKDDCQIIANIADYVDPITRLSFFERESTSTDRDDDFINRLPKWHNISSWRSSGIMFTADLYNEMFIAQRGRCKTCYKTKNGGRSDKLSVDHDHITGEIRGLLCNGCNIGLGLFRDDPKLLRKASLYIKDNDS